MYAKETYYSVKRDLTQCQKRHNTVSKETYYSVKKELLQLYISYAYIYRYDSFILACILASSILLVVVDPLDTAGGLF